jgi:DNA repair exonuclease SbcCD nuclease subunit
MDYPEFPGRVDAILASDSHLKYKLQNGRPLVGDSYESFSYVVDVAVHTNARMLLHAGDLLDSVVQGSDAPVFLASKIDRLYRNGLAFNGIKGNHDATNPAWFLVDPRARHMHEKIVEAGPYRIYGLDFQPAGELQTALAKFKDSGADALMCHQAWREISPPMASTHGAFTDIPEARLVITGDLHKTILKTFTGADGQDMLVVSPGSGCIQAINEPVDKYAMAILEDGTFHPFQLPTRVVHDTGEIMTDTELEYVLDNATTTITELLERSADLPEQLRRPILRARFNITIPKVLTRLRRAFSPALYLFEQPLSPKSKEQQRARETLRSKGSSLGFIPRLREAEGVSADVTVMVERLWESEDPAATLMEIEKEFFAVESVSGEVEE